MKKCLVCKIATVLAGIGALNWGLVALFDLDLVATLLGSMPTVAKIVYMLVGVSGFLILASLVLGVITAFVGLIVIVPVIGYAAWHGYLETIDADAFPRHAEGITATPRPDNVMKHDPVI